MVGGCSGWARLVGVLFEISIVCLFFVPWSVCGVVGSCVVAAALFVVVVVWGLVALWVGCSCFLVCFCFSGCGLLVRVSWLVVGVCVVVACGWFVLFLVFFGEFDPGSGRTLAACLTHASRTERPPPFGGGARVANG